MMKNIFSRQRPLFPFLPLLVALPLVLFLSCNKGDDNEKPKKFTDIYEPNDTTAYDLGDLPTGDIKAKIDGPADLDRFMFTTNNPGYYDIIRVELTNQTKDFSPVLVWYEENGKVDTTLTAGPGKDLALDYVTPGGTFYLLINANQGKSTGVYTFSVENMDANDAFEPNETRKNAADLGLIPITASKGVLLSPRENDWYQFIIEPAGTTQSISFLLANKTTDASLVADLYGKSFTPIQSVQSDPGADITMTVDLTGATYYLRVNAVPGEEKIVGYELSITP